MDFYYIHYILFHSFYSVEVHLNYSLKAKRIWKLVKLIFFFYNFPQIIFSYRFGDIVRIISFLKKNLRTFSVDFFPKSIILNKVYAYNVVNDRETLELYCL